MHYLRRGDNILLESNDGQRDEFIWNGNSFTPPPGKHFQLNEYESGKFMLVSHHGYKFYFDDPLHGKITSMEDRNENTIKRDYRHSWPHYIA